MNRTERALKMWPEAAHVAWAVAAGHVRCQRIKRNGEPCGRRAERCDLHDLRLPVLAQFYCRQHGPGVSVYRVALAGASPAEMADWFEHLSEHHDARDQALLRAFLSLGVIEMSDRALHNAAAVRTQAGPAGPVEAARMRAARRERRRSHAAEGAS